MPINPIDPVAMPQALAGAEGAGGGAPAPGFAQALGDGLQQVSDLEHGADAAIQDMATGGPTKIHEVMAASAESQLAVDMLGQVRDRALESYQEIMRLQL